MSNWTFLSHFNSLDYFCKAISSRISSARLRNPWESIKLFNYLYILSAIFLLRTRSMFSAVANENEALM